MAAVELAHTETGSGEPLVLLHAFPLHGAMFDAVRASLADRARVITPDFRGFGTSPKVPATTLDDMADDVAALLDRLRISRCVLGGVSMGGYVAMAMLRRHRHRVAAAVLIDTKAGADDDAARQNRERMAQAVLEHGPRALRPLLDSLLGETTRRKRLDVVELVTGWLDDADPAAVAAAQRAMAGRPDSFATLAESGVPGFVVVGEEDTLTTHDDALAMAGAFPRAAPVHVIPSAGHLAPVENPDGVSGALADVLRHL